MIRITNTVSLDDAEISFTFSTSSGPGGQHVNRVCTRATLHFDVIASGSLSERQKDLVMRRLATRINREGILRVVSQRHRSQRGNREAARERFVEILRDALREVPPRKRPRVPRSLIERRLKEKRRRARLKRERAKPVDDE